jgi:hypothetical protein
VKGTVPPGLAIRLEQCIGELTDALLARIYSIAPGYATLDEQERDDLAPLARNGLRTFFICYFEGREPTEEDLAGVRVDAVRQAQERVPIEDVLAAYYLGGEVVWEFAAEQAEPDEYPELIDLGTHLLHWQGILVRAMAAAYRSEERQLEDERTVARRELAYALLRAPSELPTATSPQPIWQLMQRAELRLPQPALVLALAPADPDPVPPERWERRAQLALDELAREPVLAALDHSSGVLLVPDGVPAGAVLKAVEESLEAPLRAGAARAESADEVAAAAALARELLDLATRLRLPAGAWTLDELLYEHAIAGRPSAVAQIARLLDPLRSRESLVDTLDAWFTHDFDRQATSAALGIHPNTLDYRLRRVGELTGLDVGTARGVQLAGAALVAQRLVAED